MIIYVLFAAIIGYVFIFVYKTKTGSPYVPSGKSEIEKMLKYVKRGDIVGDFGAGDGRVLTASIGAGAREAWGFEIEPHVWILGKLKNRHNRRVHLLFGSMWRDDFSKYDVIFVYQLERYAEKFTKKAKREMKKNALVVSNTYSLPRQHSMYSCVN